MWPHTLDEMSTIILIFCRDGANKIELIEKCYLNDIGIVGKRTWRILLGM